MKRFGPFVARLLVEQLQRWEEQVRTAITKLQACPQWRFRYIRDWTSGPTSVDADLWDWVEIDCTSAARIVVVPDPSPTNAGAHIVVIRRESSGSNAVTVVTRSGATIVTTTSVNGIRHLTSSGTEWGWYY